MSLCFGTFLLSAFDFTVVFFLSDAFKWYERTPSLNGKKKAQKSRMKLASRARKHTCKQVRSRKAS